MYSRLVSLKPPFFALVNGVRMASVMTMSSAFLEVLCSNRQTYANSPGQVVLGKEGGPYICESALPGDRCLRMEPRRSTAIVAICMRYKEEQDRKEMRYVWTRNADDEIHNWRLVRYRRRRWRRLATTSWLPKAMWGPVCRGISRSSSVS